VTGHACDTYQIHHTITVANKANDVLDIDLLQSKQMPYVVWCIFKIDPTKSQNNQILQTLCLCNGYFHKIITYSAQNVTATHNPYGTLKL
jgi:hypothetical protein